MKKGIFIIVIGLLLLAIDIRIPVGKVYPEMGIEEELGTEFQGKVKTNVIGTRPTADIISDLLGYGFLFIGAMLLLSHSKRFLMAMLLIPLAVYYYVTIPQLPYHLQLKDLYLKAAGDGLILVTLEILIEFFIVHGIIKMTNCMQNQWNNNELLVGWILAMMSKGVLVGINFFFGHGALYYIYTLFMIGATVFYINRLFVTLKFKPEKKTK